MFLQSRLLKQILKSNELAFRKPVSNHLFLMYCLLGGMYYEKNVNRKIRFLWVLYNSTLFITAITGSLWHLLFGVQDIALILSSILNSVISVYATVVLPVFMYFFRKDLMEIIKIIDEVEDDLGDTYNPKALSQNSYNTTFIIIFQSIVMFTFAFTNPLFTLISSDKALLRDPFNYVFLIPFTHNIDSMLLYMAIYSVQIFLTLFAMLIPVLFPPFLLIIATEIKNRFLGLCRQLSRISENTTEKIEFLHFERLSGSNSGGGSRNDVSVHCDHFMHQLEVMIRRYKRTLYFANKFKPFMDFNVSIFILVFAGIQLAPAYIVTACLNTQELAHSWWIYTGVGSMSSTHFRLFGNIHKCFQKASTPRFCHYVVDMSIFFQKSYSNRFFLPPTFVSALFYAPICSWSVAHVVDLWPIIEPTNAPLNIKIKETAVLLCTDGLLFVCCVVGRMFDEINELVTQEVYSTPWHYFPARHRKFIHILLCQVNYPLRIFAMRIIPISMDVFPKMIRIVYSYINFLHNAVVNK